MGAFRYLRGQGQRQGQGQGLVRFFTSNRGKGRAGAAYVRVCNFNNLLSIYSEKLSLLRHRSPEKAVSVQTCACTEKTDTLFSARQAICGNFHGVICVNCVDI